MNLNKIGLTLQTVGVLIAAETRVFAHGIDERPGLGETITLILSAGWIVIAVGIVFFIRRLIRHDAAKHKRSRERTNNIEEP